MDWIISDLPSLIHVRMPGKWEVLQLLQKTKRGVNILTQRNDGCWDVTENLPRTEINNNWNTYNITRPHDDFPDGGVWVVIATFLAYK